MRQGSREVSEARATASAQSNGTSLTRNTRTVTTGKKTCVFKKSV